MSAVGWRRSAELAKVGVQASLLAPSRPRRAGRLGRDLERAQWSTPTAIEAMQTSRLNKVLEAAISRSPFYREHLGPAWASVGPLRRPADLGHFPLVDRSDIVAHVLDMLTAPPSDRGVVRGATGGTSGTPMPFYTDADYRIHLRLLCARLYRTLGRQNFTPTVLLAGSPIDSAAWMSAMTRVTNLARRTTVIPAFDISVARLPGIIADLRRKRPPVVMGYASTMEIIARYCLSVEARVELPVVVPLAELVTAVHRQLFAEAFGAETFEVYGAREATGIAVECRAHEGLHIQEDGYVVEILRGADPAPPGEVGEIVLTDLHNTLMPLVRYRIGDVGVRLPDPCSCGRGFALMKVTHGRVLDMIVAPGGALVPGEYFPHLFKEVERDVEAFQVHQPVTDRLDITMVVRAGARPDLDQYLTERIAAKVGPEVTLTFRRVDEIAPEASGKRRPTRSDVPVPW